MSFHGEHQAGIVTPAPDRLLFATFDVEPNQLDAGLYFLAFQRDPRHQFVPIQTRLAGHDALNEYVRDTGSALFAIPPGVRAGGFVGDTLLG